ncbi:branched-chain amino acid ABC transporter permease [Halarcobacter anaerophilus]|uniref:Branched-chain amino acid ABC transporter permease n=1 Tax=Halarcobacter anaerophilus TaxID=877500 RepID=A0A4Q0Y781_9BACT|nr:branched-chain amino acid ABC transporter permease [Halarcobacter anaerophilus]QDF29575.1 high-affinity branched-chain amino acid ABC transporter, permease protein [Halarcobacter anaerophilus]RXJ64809.1 branched-chain amino acid ABC transporter permease [Halarcobacter anaerophilus]
MNKTTILATIFIVVMAVFPFLVDSTWLTIGITFLVFATVAFSQDIILGRAGVFNMGHAIFFGIGAYTTAILNVHFGFEIIETIPFAIIFPIIIAILLAGPIIHLRGDYLLVATIGFNIIFEQVLKNDVFGLTGGPNGIFGIDVVRIFGYELFSDTAIYYMAFILMILTLIIIRNLDNSRYGRALYYINKDEIAAKSMGINIPYYKLFAFALGAAIAGAAGSIFAVQYSAVSPESFNFMQSVMFFAIVLVGGSASLPGVIIGTFVMFVLPELFTEFKESRYLIFGAAMVLTMVLRPNGVWPATFGNIPKFLRPNKGAK